MMRTPPAVNHKTLLTAMGGQQVNFKNMPHDFYLRLAAQAGWYLKDNCHELGQKVDNIVGVLLDSGKPIVAMIAAQAYMKELGVKLTAGVDYHFTRLARQHAAELVQSDWYVPYKEFQAKYFPQKEQQ